ncbi:DUF5709 domain-containing protein [Streptomyces sp. A3M-1-3]|uniref:DUF5709 domain-containing protein n=1 Tax=Streptomyces sp. A3M-1-3 TaxID=2962044 RepID=UPI0020B80D50|nr:DUF5709 domain-containing protein [Streptomyces sp. A3M-1-3]MCP3820603.1 DUF5709 domain-containing protein [Streptomyces sp. A3M-1-3]
MTESAMGDDVYQPDGSEVQDDAGLLDAEDTLEDPAREITGDGYSPPERPWAVEEVGTTASEQHRGETLDERLAREAQEVSVPEGDGLGDTWDTDGELIDNEVGEERAGRLVAPDEGAHSILEKSLIAHDIGIDGAASAEEAAMHLIPESEES